MLDQFSAKWQNYDELYTDIAGWLKVMEMRVKESSSLQSNLEDKQKQLDALKVKYLIILCGALHNVDYEVIDPSFRMYFG